MQRPAAAKCEARCDSLDKLKQMSQSQRSIISAKRLGVKIVLYRNKTTRLCLHYSVLYYIVLPKMNLINNLTNKTFT